MPDNFLLQSTKGVEKPKFSLSLNRKNANKLSKENLSESLKNFSCLEPNDNKENKPVKRPLKSTYHSTLRAAKKLKPLTDSELAKPQGMVS